MSKKRIKGGFVKDHVLVPKHAKISDKGKKALFANYTIDSTLLPKISIHDPAVADLGVKPGDVIKIVRKSPTAGEVVFYRGVIDE